MTPALEAVALVAGYERDLPIVRGVDLAVAAGEFVALLGPNGAGKSTLVKAIAGLVPVHSGQVRLAGAEINRRALAREGAARPRLRAADRERLRDAEHPREPPARRAESCPRPRRAGRIAALYGAFPDLAARPGARAGALSGGQRQMLAVARALVVEPAVLILDEPSAGLSPKIAGEVFARLRAINRTGVAIVLVEQNVRAALAVADRAVILVEGRIAHEGAAATLVDDPLVGELYLGARRAEPAS